MDDSVYGRTDGERIAEAGKIAAAEAGRILAAEATRLLGGDEAKAAAILGVAAMALWAGAAGLHGPDVRPPADPAAPAAPLSKPMSLAEAEKAAIEAAMRHHGGNRTRAAASLGVTPQTLRVKLRSYGLD